VSMAQAGGVPWATADVGMQERDAALGALLARGLTDRGRRGEPLTWLFEPETFAPMARSYAGEAQSILCDHMCTPVLTMDNVGALVSSSSLSAYGVLRDVAEDLYTSPFRWAGQYEDLETGLYYNRFRYYDPEGGQYICQDPMGLGAGTAFYRYVADPCSRTDPFGLADCGPHDRPKLPGDTLVHRIGGASPANLALKPPEKSLTPPGISLLRAQSPEHATAMVRNVARRKGWSKMEKNAGSMGTARVADIRDAGFDVIHDPTDTWGDEHARLIHRDGVAGFNAENLQKLSNAFSGNTGL